MNFVKIPGLPTAPVTLAALAASPRLTQALGQQGIGVITTKPVEALPGPVAHHCDLQLLHLGHNRVLLAQEAQYMQTTLNKLGFETEFIDVPLSKKYPSDISLNFLLYNLYCFGLCSNIPLQLVNHCNNADLTVVHSNQGYARCSVAIVSPNAAMTADPTLCRLLSDRGTNVLELDYGDIVLQGYDTGFIGGCCGLIDKDKLAFAGSLEGYKYGNRVLEFLRKHNVTPVYLQDSKLQDIGGIIPLGQL